MSNKKKSVYEEYFPLIKNKSNYVYLETLGGKKYKLPRKVFIHLVEAKNRVEQELDSLFVITGSVGAGKSNIEIGMGGTWENLFYKREFGLDDLYWRAEDISAEMDRFDNFNKALCFDEAIQGASTQDGITKIGKIYSNKLDTKRFKGHMLISCIPSIKKFSPKALERCIAWYHVELHKDVKTGKYNKGRLKVFSIEEAIQVATWLNKEKHHKTEHHPIVKKKRCIQIDNFMDGLWFTKNEYNKVKSEKTAEVEEEETAIENKVQMQRDRSIVALLETGKKQQEVANIVGLSRSMIADIKSNLSSLKNI